MGKYIRLCEGGVNRKGKLIPASDDIYSHITTLNKDSYRSIYYYNQKHFDQFNDEIIDEDTGEVKLRGVSGVEDVYTDRLVFDFDDEYDIGQAKDDAVTLCARLIEHGINKEAIQICYSGKKGFGIEVEVDAEFTPSEFKNVVHNLADGLKTFDPKIWNASRVMRLPYTKHAETGLYKLPLTLQELSDMTINDIVEEAKHEYEVEIPATWSKIKLPESIVKLKKVAPTIEPIEVEMSTDALDLDFSDKPRWLSKWKYAILNGYFPAGTRHYALMILTATCKNQGIPKEVTLKMLCGALDLHAKRFDPKYTYNEKKIFNTIIKSVYNPLWQGGTYSEESFPDDLKRYLVSIGLSPEFQRAEKTFVNIDDVFNIFSDFAINIDKNTIKTGVKPLDDMIRITTSMLVGVVGAPGTGKTSLALNMIEALSASNEHAAFYSLDMAAPLIYQKLAQRYSGKTASQIFDMFALGEDEEGKAEIRKMVGEHFKNVNLSFRTASTVDSIKQDIIHYQEAAGVKLRLVVIDYLECVTGPYSDSTANTAFIAQKLKDLANELGVCVLLLLQPSKRYGDPAEPVKSYRNIKGSSAIEQAASIIIGMWRDGFDPMNPQNDNYASLSVLKNRMGTLGQVDCAWNGLRGDIYELDDAGKVELKKLREWKEEQKAQEDDGF